MTRKIVGAFFGDGHSNSTVGLCPPKVALDDGGTHLASRAQHWLWECWLDYCQQVKREVTKGARLYAVVNGDALEVDAKKRSTQLISRNKADILRMGREAYAPMLEDADRSWFVRGTGAHGGKSAEYEELLAGDWDNVVPCAENGRNSWWDLQADWGGVLFDILHHTGGDSQPWTTGAAMVRLASATILEYVNRGERVPQFLIRSHMHRYRDSRDNVPACRAVTLPAFSLATEYVSRLGKRLLADVGGAIVTIENGKANFRVIEYKAPKRQPWREKE